MGDYQEWRRAIQVERRAAPDQTMPVIRPNQRQRDERFDREESQKARLDPLSLPRLLECKPDPRS